MRARTSSRSLYSFTPCLALLQALAGPLPSADFPHAFASTSAIAAPPESGIHRGWVITFGAGAGRPDLSCDGCTYDRDNGFSAFLSAGRVIHPSTLLGIEASGWTKTRSSTTLRVYTVMAALTQYLSRAGFFLSGGLGLIGFDQNSDFGDISAKGLGFSGRAGYEVALGGLTVAPYVSYARSLLGAQVNGDFDITISNVQVGVSLVVP
jgi:hypothetical protein